MTNTTTAGQPEPWQLGRGQLDALAQSLKTRRLNKELEEAFLILRHDLGVVVLQQVANRHEDPKNHVAFSREDAEPYLQAGLEILGFVHTHPRGREYLDGPTYDDIRNLKPGALGGVHKIGTNRVHWYDKSQVFHITDLRYIDAPTHDGEMTA